MMRLNDKPVLIIDCQIFQTFSWTRGMGKYSMELIRATLDKKTLRNNDIVFLFTTRAEQHAEIEAALKQVAPSATFAKLDLAVPKEPREENPVQTVRLTNKKTLNDYILQEYGLNKPKFLILSLYLDEVCSVFPDGDIVSDKIILYYDSIPYLYHERYGRFKNFFEHYYLPHTASVFEATKILTISKTVANDLHLYFGIPVEKIFNIDGASIPRATQAAIKPKGWKYPAGKFILMPTGQEIRKNNERAVRAFEQYLRESDSDMTLIITSSFSAEGRAELQAISGRVDFTGNVSEGELLWLYQNCSFVLFPSEYEGLGLPVLEAVDENKVVACSDISVFREMSNDAFIFFDPIDIQSIAEGIKKGEIAAQAGSINAAAYKNLRAKYSWQRTGLVTNQALNAIPKLSTVTKKKIAIFSPDPSGFSAIGKDVGELHAWYSQYFDIDYYFDKGPNHRPLRPNILAYAANCRAASDFKLEDYKNYDAIIYHVGNSEYHLNIIKAALAFPGYMILHDTNLSGAYHNLLELGYITRQRYDTEVKLESMLSSIKYSDQATLIASLVNKQHAVITHSKYAHNAVKAKLLRKTPVKYLELPFETPMFTEVLTHGQYRVTIAFAGIIAKIKGIDIMEAIAMNGAFTDCHINIFGFSAVDTDQLKMLRQLPNVSIATNTSDFEFQELLKASDIMVNVRLAYRGETSGSTLSHMRYGGIGIVRDFGWFSELPDDVVLKVAEPEDTLETLQAIVADIKRRKIMHAKSIEFMAKQHTHRAYVEGMYKLINDGVQA